MQANSGGQKLPVDVIRIDAARACRGPALTGSNRGIAYNLGEVQVCSQPIEYASKSGKPRARNHLERDTGLCLSSPVSTFKSHYHSSDM